MLGVVLGTEDSDMEQVDNGSCLQGVRSPSWGDTHCWRSNRVTGVACLS